MTSNQSVLDIDPDTAAISISDTPGSNDINMTGGIIKTGNNAVIQTSNVINFLGNSSVDNKLIIGNNLFMQSGGDTNLHVGTRIDSQYNAGRDIVFGGQPYRPPLQRPPRAEYFKDRKTELAGLLAEELATGLDAPVRAGEMTGVELAAARDLSRKRYESDRWTYRRSSSR